MIVLWTSGNFIAPPLVAARTVNKLDLDDDKRFEEENYEDYQIRHYKRHYRRILPQIFYLVSILNYKVILKYKFIAKLHALAMVAYIC